MAINSVWHLDDMINHIKRNKLPRPTIRFILFLLICASILVACAGGSVTRGQNEFDTHYKLGVAHYSKGDLGAAYVEFQKAIKEDSRHKESLNYLGNLSARFDKYEEAETYYRRAIAVDRHYSEALNNLGALYLDMQKWDEAITYFEKALQNPIYETPEKAYTNLGFAYLKKEDYISAQDSIKRALMRKRNFPRAIFVQGLVFVKLHEDDAAIESFLKIIDVMPRHVEAHWELAKAYVRTGEREKAIQHFQIVADTGEKEIAQEAVEYIELLKR